MFLHDESAVNTEQNGCVRKEYVRGVVGGGGASTVFTVFSYYPTTCGLAVPSPSNLQLQLLSQFWGLSLCNFTGRDS